jgi:hypothetical protein
MKLVTESITVSELKEMSTKFFSGLVKAVVDIEKGIMVLDAELHADEEKYLIEQGSKQENLWGINLYPELEINDEDFIEFDSMINIRPRISNNSRGVEDPKVRKEIIDIVNKLVTE